MLGALTTVGLSLPAQPASAHGATPPATPTPPPINCPTKYTVSFTWQAKGHARFAGHVPLVTTWNKTTHDFFGKGSHRYSDYDLQESIREKAKPNHGMFVELVEDPHSRDTYSFGFRAFPFKVKSYGSAIVTLTDNSTFTIGPSSLSKSTSAATDGWATYTGTQEMGAKNVHSVFAKKITALLCLK